MCQKSKWARLSLWLQNNGGFIIKGPRRWFIVIPISAFVLKRLNHVFADQKPRAPNNINFTFIAGQINLTVNEALHP